MYNLIGNLAINGVGHVYDDDCNLVGKFLVSSAIRYSAPHFLIEVINDGTESIWTTTDSLKGSGSGKSEHPFCNSDTIIMVMTLVDDMNKANYIGGIGFMNNQHIVGKWICYYRKIAPAVYEFDYDKRVKLPYKKEGASE